MGSISTPSASAASSIALVGSRPDNKTDFSIRFFYLNLSALFFSKSFCSLFVRMYEYKYELVHYFVIRQNGHCAAYAYLVVGIAELWLPTFKVGHGHCAHTLTFTLTLTLTLTLTFTLALTLRCSGGPCWPSHGPITPTPPSRTPLCTY